jgi:hypothetical protein
LACGVSVNAAILGHAKAITQEIADPNKSAANVLKQMFKDAEAQGKDPLAVVLGRRGGLKGGHARAAKMTAKEWSEREEGC